MTTELTGIGSLPNEVGKVIMYAGAFLTFLDLHHDSLLIFHARPPPHDRYFAPYP